MTIVVFNYATWSARFPELASAVDETLATIYFQEAQIFVDNTDCSPILAAADGGFRDTLLNLVTAHIAALNANIGGNPSSPLVGRINNATQGSVSVGTDYMVAKSDTQAYFNQTEYGAEYWAMAARYRRFRYVSNPARNEDPWNPLYNGTAFIFGM